MSLDAQASDVHASTIELLERLFALARQVALHGTEHEQVLQCAQAMRGTLSQAQPPFALQVLPEVVLRDGVPVALGVETYRRTQQLVGALGRWGVGELAFEAVLAPDDLIAFARAVLDATHSGRTARVPVIEGLRLRKLRRPRADTQRGADAAADVFAVRQLEQICAALEQVIANRSAPWTWNVGSWLTWQIERCILADPAAFGRALELAPGDFSPARRAAAAAFHAHAALAQLQTSLLVQRSVAHALLVLGCFGLGERPGQNLAEAARAALPLLLPQPNEALDRDPQRLRVIALVAAVTQGERAGSALPVSALIAAAYELERQRCPQGVAFRLSRADLHAWLACALGDEVHAGWGRALLNVLGPIPAGAHVLADGRLGVVLGPSAKGDAMRPRVLVGGQPSTPAQPVTLHSPLGMTPWAK